MLRSCTFFFSLVSLSVSAQLSSGAKIVAMGNAGVAMQGVWSLTANQAGIAGIKKPMVSAGYEQRFLDKDLNAKSLVFALPVGKSVFGASFNRYGFSSFNEQKFGLTYAKQYGSNLSLAINFNFHQLSISSYGSASTFSSEIGMQYKISKALIIGAHVANPNRSNFNKDFNVSVPVNMQLGLAYAISDEVLLVNSVDKTLGYPTDFKIGGEYKVINWLSLRGGISVSPFKQFMGFGFNYQHINVDFATTSHAVLGYTPQLALGYEF